MGLGLPRNQSFLNRPPSGIWFNQQVGGTIQFSEPQRFRNSMFSATPGIYVALVPDVNGAPRKFRALYFGQAENANERVSTSHERYWDWVRAAGGAQNLFMAFHWMPRSTEEQRCAVEDELIAFYKPQCNKTANRSNPTLASFAGLPKPPRSFYL